jgi:hypothetical protein
VAIHALTRLSPPWRRRNSATRTAQLLICWLQLWGPPPPRVSKESNPGESGYLTLQQRVLARCCSPLFRTARHLYTFWSTAIPVGPKKEGRYFLKKCLASVDRLKQHQPMNTRVFICILAGAALLSSCCCSVEQNTNAVATNATRPTPTPRPRPTPRPPAGKRTETGTVIGLTPTQIRFQTSTGTYTINKSDSCLVIVSGTLAVGNTVTITWCIPSSCCP